MLGLIAREGLGLNIPVNQYQPEKPVAPVPNEQTVACKEVFPDPQHCLCKSLDLMFVKSPPIVHVGGAVMSVALAYRHQLEHLRG